MSEPKWEKNLWACEVTFYQADNKDFWFVITDDDITMGPFATLEEAAAGAAKRMQEPV